MHPHQQKAPPYGLIGYDLTWSFQKRASSEQSWLRTDHEKIQKEPDQFLNCVRGPPWPKVLAREWVKLMTWWVQSIHVVIRRGTVTQRAAVSWENIHLLSHVTYHSLSMLELQCCPPNQTRTDRLGTLPVREASRSTSSKESSSTKKPPLDSRPLWHLKEEFFTPHLLPSQRFGQEPNVSFCWDFSEGDSIAFLGAPRWDCPD